MNTESEKWILRQQLLSQLKGQDSVVRQNKSKSVLEQLKKLPDFVSSKSIMFYISLSEEVDTLPLLKETIKSGRTVTIPYINKVSNSLISVSISDPDNDLTPGSYGIMEPKAHLVRQYDVNLLDLVFVPGLAFDREGHRLGRGKGYYDRFLKTLPSYVKRIGLAFDFQILDIIPVNQHDERLDQVIVSADGNN